MDAERSAIIEDRERELVVTALTIAIAVLDVHPRGLATSDDRRNMAELLTRLADESELELQGQKAMTLVSAIAAGR